MSKNIIKVSFFLITLSIILVLLHNALINIPMDTNQYLYALKDKHKILLNSQHLDKRIILIGGSNLAYGVDSIKIEKTFSIKTINMGLSAELGLKFILSDLEPYLQKGDILVIIPEFEHFDKQQWLGDLSLLIELFDVTPNEKSFINYAQWLHLTKKLPGYYKFKILSLPSVIRKKGSSQKITVYDRRGFNNNGDVISHLNKPKGNFNIYPPLKDINFNYKAFTFLEKYIIKNEKNGIQCFLSYPSMEKASFENWKELITLVKNKITDSDVINVISTPEEYKFEHKYMFNTVYHLNKEGREIRTDLLIKDLEAINKF